MEPKPIINSSPEVIVSPKHRLPVWMQRIRRVLTVPTMLLIFGVITLILVAQRFTTSQHVEIKATNGKATISILPASITLPPDTAVQVWVTADKPVAFVHVPLTFDPSKLALAKDPVLSTDKLSRVILQTSKADANANGTYTLILGLDPAKRDSPPTGAFQLATLTFTKKTNAPNTQTSVSVDTANTSVVDTSASPFTVTGSSSSVTINPASSPTPSPSSSPTATPQRNVADLDGNGAVDTVDYTLFMNYWNKRNVDKGDLNHDGKISVIDFTIFMNGWHEYRKNK